MIRNYCKKDIPFIVRLEEKTLGSSLGYEMLEKDLNNPLCQYYVLELNERIIGYLSLVFDGYAVEILNFCIDNAFQHKGWGTKFLSEILDKYYVLNATNVILDVKENNLCALSLYKKLGFVPIHMRNNYYKNGENAIVLQKIFHPVVDIEDAYLESFAIIEKHKDYYRIHDEIQKDRYDHNYYKILNCDENLIKDLLEQPNNGYIQFMFDKPVDLEVLKDFEIEHNLFYHVNIANIDFLKNSNYIVKELNNSFGKELESFLYEEFIIYGKEYAISHSKRLLEKMNQDKIMYFGVFDSSNALVGCLHTFIFKDFAKIEDFYVQKDNRHKGYGQALFRYVIQYLKIKEIHDIVLCVSSNGTISSMYEQMGFTKCLENYVYRKVLTDGKDECNAHIRAKEN